MTETIQTPTDTDSGANEFLHIDPTEVIVGINVRTDLRSDHKEFRTSIKQRGVLEAVTVYCDEDGRYVLLRGQRRTVTAAQVGTPSGLIPARVVPEPADADRISDQMVENIHRAGMRDAEIVAGVEQLTLLGVSAAQITKRLSLPRPTVNAALAITNADQSRNRLEAGDLTLDEAAIFAEFEHNAEAVERLDSARRFRQPLAHIAQRLRDEATERATDDAEIERLRDEGLPVLSAEEITSADEVLRIERLVTSAGEPVPPQEWVNVPGARVHVVKEWFYPEDEHDEINQDAEGTDDDGERGEPYQQYVPVWVVTDLEESGLRRRGFASAPANTAASGPEDLAQVEVRREERRRVIANNKAWVSAETVRREWLTVFLTRKTAPKDAEALICEALVTGQHFLSKAMEQNHPMLRTLLDHGANKSPWDSASEVASIATKACTPKGAIMTTLAAVVTAWEATTGKHSWRNPTRWDARMLGALIHWGYEPSDVEQILLGDEATPSQYDTTAATPQTNDSPA